MRGHVAALALCVSAACVQAAEPAAPAPADARPPLLRALDGHWLMRGDVMGEPVTYTLQAGPTLGAAFTELHMRDVQQPPQYEARVFVGVDPKTGTLYAHWMDSFGAAFSVPHGTGTLGADEIRFTIPYADGAMRDVFRRDPKDGSWTLEIESAQPDGSWKHFARYAISPR